MYYVYFLRCADGSLYVGITTDLRRRLREHRGEGGRGAKYTRAHPPLGYAGAWLAPDRAAAGRLEYRLKKLSHSGREAVAGTWLPGYTAVPEEALREAEG
jgi:putative endonuclease